MRKFLVSILTLSAAVAAAAAPVSRDRAAGVAASLFGTESSSLKPQKAPRASVAVPERADELYYIFNNPEGGFAIISALDNTLPVLGYSDSGSFNPAEIPAPALDWLMALEKELSNILETDPEPSEEASSLWRAPSQPGQNPVMRETPTWGQGAPYNALCPEVSGTRCMTGCCATAASEVLRYHCWPETRTATIPAYTSCKNVAIEMDARGPVTYDWANMPMTGGNDAVALLMADVGAAVKSDYGTSATAAVSSEMVKAITTYFGYDKSASYRTSTIYSAADWVSAIRKQIDECGPLYFRATASNPDAAHAFVLDGRADHNYFHFNFGWTGSSNGWFLLSALGPASGYTFTVSQAAIFDLVPDKTGNSVAMPILWFTGSRGLSCDSEVKAGSFVVNVGTFSVMSGSNFDGVIRISLQDAHGNVKVPSVNKDWLGCTVNTGRSYTQGAVSCRLSSNPVIGDKLVLQYCADNSTWRNVEFSPSKTTGELLVHPMYIIEDLKNKVVINGEKPYATAVWTLVNNTRGRVVLTYEDGTVETIIQE